MKATSSFRSIGCARRIRVRTPMGKRSAWDCRPFGLGRVIAPALPTAIELSPGTELHLMTGELRSRTATRATLAA